MAGTADIMSSALDLAKALENRQEIIIVDISGERHLLFKLIAPLKLCRPLGRAAVRLAGMVTAPLMPGLASKTDSELEQGPELGAT